MRERSRDCRPINDRQLMELSTSTTLQGVFLALRHDFGTENLASPALFTTSPQPRSRLFAIFSPLHFNDIRPWIPSNPQSVPYSGTGPKYANQGEKSFLFLPSTATGCHSFISLAVAGKCYASQFKRLNSQARPPLPNTPRPLETRPAALAWAVVWPRPAALSAVSPAKGKPRWRMGMVPGSTRSQSFAAQLSRGPCP